MGRDSSQSAPPVEAPRCPRRRLSARGTSRELPGLMLRVAAPAMVDRRRVRRFPVLTTSEPRSGVGGAYGWLTALGRGGGTYVDHPRGRSSESFLWRAGIELSSPLGLVVPVKFARGTNG